MLYRTMRYSWAISLTLLATMAAGTVSAQAAPAGKIKLLLVRNGGHDFDGFRTVFVPVFEKTGDFEVTAAQDFNALKIENLQKFDEVLFYGSGGDFSDPAQEKGLEQFVKNGGGMAGVHATDAFKNSDVYWHFTGGRFKGHGRGKFTIYLAEPRHPITTGMKDFEITDESYANTDHPKAKMESLGRMNRGDEKQSMVWVQQIDKGRVFNTTLGHDQAAWTNPDFQRLVVRGLYWAARREPKNP